jgi:hypothetical protein
VDITQTDITQPSKIIYGVKLVWFSVNVFFSLTFL